MCELLLLLLLLVPAFGPSYTHMQKKPRSLVYSVSMAVWRMDAAKLWQQAAYPGALSSRQWHMSDGNHSKQRQLPAAVVESIHGMKPCLLHDMLL